MIYDLEETNAVEEVVDNLVEMSDIKSVNVDNDCVTIDIKTHFGKIIIKRFVSTNKLSIIAE